VAVLIGYDDRVNGPMEKSLDDFVPIQEGGDIPEHRIWYFRKTGNDDQGDSDDGLETNENLDPAAQLSNVEIQELVLWDRKGRADKLFSDSGEASKVISPETIANVRDAMNNMARLEAEKKEKKRLREKERQRKQQRQKAKADALALLGLQTQQEKEPKPQLPLERYTWHKTTHFEFSCDENAWVLNSKASETAVHTSKDFKIVSWNVLFDFHDKKQNDDCERWMAIVKELEQQHATVVALQEVTPAFLIILCASELVRTEYAVTAAPPFSSTVSPYGNLLLWRKNEFRAVSTWLCRDGEKNRSNLAALERHMSGEILLVASVHLLADKLGSSAAAARRRELSSVVGQLQTLEGRLCQNENVVVPIIVGDFNANEQQNELEDGCFAGEAMVGNQPREGFFVDAWTLLSGNEPGYTFDPQKNPRAALTRAQTTQGVEPKRCDRLYIARHGQGGKINHDRKLEVELVPLDGFLLGANDELPPSDHFGLSISFGLGAQSRRIPSLTNPSILGMDAWSASIESSNDSLLGIQLGEREIGGVQISDEQSSLPIPHVTLLHGFAAMDSRQATNLAIEACGKAVKIFLEQQDRVGDDGFDLSVDPESLDVFAHQSSSSLVLNLKRHNSWLSHLYSSFTKVFPRCHHQETRFADGWTPHVTLGNFATSNTARNKIFEIRQNAEWITDRAKLPVKAITVFKRHKPDGKFYAISSIPLCKKPSIDRLSRYPVLNDGWSSYYEGQSEAVLGEIERACEFTAKNLDCTAKLCLSGSHALGVGVSGLSDIDVVVHINGDYNSSEVADKFFPDLASRLSDVHPTAKLRMRTAGSGTSSLSVLTAKLFPSSPALDIIPCVLNSNDGSPVDEKSIMAFNATKDLMSMEQSFGERSSDQCMIFRSVLRTVKMWAWKEGIYGASLGFLGGGGWAYLVHHVLSDAFLSGELGPGCNGHDALLFFFEEVKKLDSLILSAENTSLDVERAKARGTMCMIAPVSLQNYARNSTPSTTKATLHAIKSASEDSLKRVLTEKRILERLLERLRESHRFAIVATVKLQKSLKTSDGEMAQAKGWLSTQLLQLLLALERNSPGERHPRLYSNSVRQDSALEVSFSFYIGVNGSSASMSGLLKEWKQHIQTAYPSTPCQFDLAVLPTTNLQPLQH